MSTLKVASINNPSAGSGGLAISTAGLVSGAGLDLITSSTFSAVSSVSINNCFTSTYDTYLLHYDQTALSGGAVYLNFRMRAAGADATAANYRFAYMEGYTAGVAGGAANGQAFGRLGFVSNTNDVAYMATIFRPALASFTKVISDGARDNGSMSRLSFVSRHEVATAYDGITIYPDAGTLTGTIRVYGYRN